MFSPISAAKSADKSLIELQKHAKKHHVVLTEGFKKYSKFNQKRYLNNTISEIQKMPDHVSKDILDIYVDYIYLVKGV